MISSEDKELMFRDIPDKRQYKDTTSLQFKYDLVESFEDTECGEYIVLEVGTNHGHTTRILSFLFKLVRSGSVLSFKRFFIINFIIKYKAICFFI